MSEPSIDPRLLKFGAELGSLDRYFVCAEGRKDLLVVRHDSGAPVAKLVAGELVTLPAYVGPLPAIEPPREGSMGQAAPGKLEGTLVINHGPYEQ